MARKGIANKAEAAVIIVLILALVFYSPSSTTVQSQPKKFASYAELDSFLKETSAVYYGGYYMRSAAATAEAAQESAGKSSDYSATNIQVAGVDEADIVKTDGKYIYAVSGNKIVILDAYPAENAKILSEIKLEGISGIFVNRDRLIVFGNENRFYAMRAEAEKIAIYPGPSYSPSTFIMIYDITDRQKPELKKNMTVDGSYFESRMIGDYVYLIANQPVYRSGTEPIPMPAIRENEKTTTIPVTDIYYFPYPDSSYVFANIIALNTQDGSMNSKTFLMGYSQNIYVSPGNIYITYQKRLNEMDVYGRIVGAAVMPNIPPETQEKIKAIRDSGTADYEKLQEIGKELDAYLESLNPQEGADAMKKIESDAATVMKEIMKEIEKTVIHKISIADGRIEYATNGEVPGYVLNQFSMDENSGYFRIATTTNQFWGGPMLSVQSAVRTVAQDAAVKSQVIAEQVTEKPAQAVAQPIVPPQPRSESKNHVYILDSSMKITGKLEDLAPGERIYSVRFIGDKGYMVTFRQIDPLFVIDLTPDSPKVLGFLKIPGVSDYLHPYDENHLIGVGRDATEQGMVQGLKLSLFDVTDVSSPRELSKYIIGERGTHSEALNDHKAFLFSREKSLLAIPVSLVEGGNYNAWNGAFVFNVDLTNGFTLKGKITHAEEQEKLKPAKEEPVGTGRKDYSGYTWEKSGENQWTTDVSGYEGIVYNDYTIDTFPGGTNYYPYDYQAQIRRSLYIENVLYTVSGGMIKMNSLGDLAEINKLSLPVTDKAGYFK